MNFKKVALAATCTAMLGGVSGVVTTANAANWLMLQGTERADAAPRARVWGFVQAQYQTDSSDANAGGAYVPPKLIGPNLKSQSQFNVNRARIGIRGQGMPLDGKVNYFLLAEFGNNAITAGNNGVANVTDASITLNHIDGARIRLGLFKTPGFEEGLQAIHVFDYINFTAVGNQLMLERFPNAAGSGTPNVNPGDNNNSDLGPITLPSNTGLGAFDRPVGAFRDVGIQVFDTFKSGKWEHSYAIMSGNGNGLNFGDNDDERDTYLYWSSELVLGGKGPFRSGLKLFAWNQTGKRNFDGNGDGTVETYDRDRSGFGVKYKTKKWRASAEFMSGEGMIFNGPDKPSFSLVGSQIGNVAHPGNGLNAKASGYYVEGGYYIPGTNWDVGLRYDVYNRLEDTQFELEFVTTTLGVQYQFNKKTRLTLNYEMHSAEAINFAAGAGPNGNLDGVGDRTAIQLTHIF